MPVFYILVILGLGLLWLLLSFLFKPLGNIGHRLWKDAKDSITEEDNDKEMR